MHDMSEPVTVKAQGFKAAWRQMVDAGPLPVKALADVLGVSEQQVYAYGDPSIDQTPPIHRLVTALGLCPATPVTQYFAGIQNAVVVPLPKANDPDVCKLADVHQEMGVFLRKHGDAIRDGRITQAEAAEYADIARRLQSCIAAQVLYFERCATSNAPANVTPLRRGGAA